MSSEQEDDPLINNELFHLYTEYQLCKVKKSRPSIWNADDSEKNALISILTQCQKINGNTLRLVMKDIFDNSVVKYTDSNSSMINYTPHMNSSTGRIPEVIVNATDDETDSVTSREVARSAIYTNVNFHDPMDIDHDNAAISRRNILPSSTLRLGRSVTPKLEPKKEKQKEDDRNLRMLLTDNGIVDLAQMTSQVGRTKAMLRERIYAVNDSVLVSFSSTTSETFSVLNYASCSDTNEKTLYRCQENFIGFRFGKLFERLNQEYPEKVAIEKAKKYYKELQRELKRQGKTYYTLSWSAFKLYSSRMVKYVNEFGIYCLFIPNIIAPTRFKRTTFGDLRRVLQYLDEACFVFKDIVKVDREGNIIKPQRKRSSKIYHM